MLAGTSCFTDCDRSFTAHIFGNGYSYCDFDAICYGLDTGIFIFCAEVLFVCV